MLAENNIVLINLNNMTRFLFATFLVVTILFSVDSGFAEKSRTKKPKTSSSSVKKSKKSKPQKVTTKKVGTKKSKPNSPSKKDRDDEEIVLRKSNGTRKTAFDNEDLGDIYKKERAFFRSGNSAKKEKPSTVKGPLAAIPTAVVETIVLNLVRAHNDRMPKVVNPPTPEPVAKTPDQLFNVEPTIQGSKKIVESKPENPPPSGAILASLAAAPKSSKKVALETVQSEIAKELNLVKTDAVDTRKPSSDEKDPLAKLATVEKKYTSYFITMDVKSEVTQALLERTKTYSGKIYLAPGGMFKMEVLLPNKHMVLMNGKNIWVVDYPLDETQDKVQILHSKSAKNLKNQAFLSIFQGVGKLKKNFKIESSIGKNDEITYKLTPKNKGDQIDRIELKVDPQSELISSLSFWDSIGNQTQLQFSEQDFESKTPPKTFQFKPPKNSSITYL